MKSGVIEVCFYNVHTRELVDVQNLAYEEVVPSHGGVFAVQQYIFISSDVDYHKDIMQSMQRQGIRTFGIQFVSEKWFGSRAAKNIHDLSNHELFNVYYLYRGNVPIMWNRKKVIYELLKWAHETGTKLEF